MEEVKNVATRDSYGQTLVELGAENPNIVVMDADLAAATKTALFAKAYPDRFFDAGIAEANMMGIAAGMASCGKTVFCSSFAMFATGRSYEQIRNTIGYPKLNVKVCASHAGITVGEDGASHQCIEDIALMRAIPGMVVMCPADDVEARAAVRAAAEYKGPVYMRLGRAAVPVINDPATYKFEWGKGIKVKEGKDLTFIASGVMVDSANKAAKMLEADGIDAEIIDIHTIKPIDEDIILESAKKTGVVITLEEHSIIGGLGSAVCDVLCEKFPCRVKKIGINDVYGESGSASALMEKYQLDGKGVYAQTKAYLDTL